MTISSGYLASTMAERLIRTIREKLGPLLTMYETARRRDLQPQ